MMQRLLLTALLSVAAFAPAAAQRVPTPLEHFGFEIGADRKLANWTQLTAYYEALARTSPRVTVDTLGLSTKGLPFVMLTITSPENHARLDELREVQSKLADPRRVSGPEELERLLDEGRTIVLITHQIHSTEVGSGQAAARLAYELASSNEPRILEILDNVILLQIPSLNPDGTQWVSDWYMRHVGTPFEGTAPPWLYHFYVGHDNNRDWYAFTQVETQLTVEKVHNVWHPQIVHDIHQMGGNGARIFAPPFIDPVEPNVDPAIVAALNQLGSYIAAELISQGKQGVVINAIYDAWTPARAYQHYHGGVRILTETASARLATPVEVPKERVRGGREYDASQRSWKHPLPWTGGTWRLRDIVEYQTSGALALLVNAAKNRRFWLENFYRINERAVRGWPEWPAAWVIPADQPNESGLAYVLRILTMGAVEVHRATEAFSAGGRQFPAGTYVIPMQQPSASFAQTLLEVQEYPDLREYAGGPPKRPYDVTAHTLPLLMNVEAVAVDSWEGEPPALSEPISVQPFRFALPDALRGARAPRIALYKSAGEPMTAGWTRWVFDQHGLRYDTLKDARVRAGGLERDYDVILFQSQSANAIRRGYPEGSLPREYTGGIGDAGVQALRSFVEAGGRIVAVEEATDLFIELFGLGIENAVEGLPRQEFYVPGSILRLDLDASHPLARSVGASTHAWYWGSSRAFEVTDPAIRVVARYGEGNPAASGWILGPEALAGKAALVEARVGRGSVVLFGFQPNYRGQSVATWPLLFDALAGVPAS
ncbi:MAG TPA: M14 metallopeptidase family protein [Longimicrobiales bacterium]